MARGGEKMKRAMEDERFAAARTYSKFRPMRRKEAKVALDSRFSPLLKDPMFDSSDAAVDKRGRRGKKRGRRGKKSARENPMLYYYLNQEAGDKREKEKKPICEEGEDEQDEEERYSSDDEEEDDDVQYSADNDMALYLMARDTAPIVKETHRLAVVHMDWDHIKAVDLYMVMTSCILNDGQVLSVSIYPTKFGLKCMNIETTQGPSALIAADGDGDSGEHENNVDDDNDDGEEDSDFDSENENNKLCTCGLNRLRYYYAVVVCDSSATANHLYMMLDGTEFLETANVFDLRFIPDSREFKYPARDVATEEPPSYKWPDFETRALQRSKVKLPWVDGEPECKILRRKSENELDDIALDDDDDSSDESLRNDVAERKLRAFNWKKLFKINRRWFNNFQWRSSRRTPLMLRPEIDRPLFARVDPNQDRCNQITRSVGRLNGTKGRTIPVIIFDNGNGSCCLLFESSSFKWSEAQFCSLILPNNQVLPVPSSAQNEIRFPIENVFTRFATLPPPTNMQYEPIVLGQDVTMCQHIYLFDFCRGNARVEEGNVSYVDQKHFLLDPKPSSNLFGALAFDEARRLVGVVYGHTGSSCAIQISYLRTMLGRLIAVPESIGHGRGAGPSSSSGGSGSRFL